MKLPMITRDENCIYLIQDISELKGYERAKAIVHFCDKEIKTLEKEIDRAVLEIFEKNGINVPSTDKSALKLAFGYLKSKGKDIKCSDLYSNISTLYKAEPIKQTKLFNIYLEDDRYLQAGVVITEEKI